MKTVQMFTPDLQELRRETSTLNLIVDANDPIQGRKVARFVKFVGVLLRSPLYVFFFFVALQFYSNVDLERFSVSSTRKAVGLLG
jgi:hypothetical protein